MSAKTSDLQMVARRGELIAELFLQDLEPHYIAKASQDLGCDFFVGFLNSEGGINTFGVQVKATERKVTNRFSVGKKVYEQLAYSNIPMLLLVVDVKLNRLFYAWITRDDENVRHTADAVSVPVTQVGDTDKESLRKQFADRKFVASDALA